LAGVASSTNDARFEVSTLPALSVDQKSTAWFSTPATGAMNGGIAVRLAPPAIVCVAQLSTL